MNNNKIAFENADHENKYYEYLNRMCRQDNLHRCVAYLLALIGDEAEDLFDFEHNVIKPEGIHEAWQTSNTVRATALLFSLWNAYDDDHNRANPYNIFGYNYWDKYYIEALKIYCHDSLSQPTLKLKI